MVGYYIKRSKEFNQTNDNRFVISLLTAIQKGAKIQKLS
ncbi:hypothetical protein BBD27_0727 [Streptococcus thermophilus]|nr:hypothetical protein BBD27_0727 [Streptococcus thermophilus]KPL37512.1 hypothetical protein ADU38_744 [Streptococcus thermophilus]